MNLIKWIENNMLAAGRDAGWVGRGDIDMEIITQPNRIVVRCGTQTDRLDATAAAVLRKVMLKKVVKNAQPDRPVILDLHGVNYIDDRGLGAILSVMKMAQEKSDMLLCGAGENLQKIFKLTRVDGVLKNYDSIDEAELEARRRIQQRQASGEAVRHVSLLQYFRAKLGGAIH